MRLVQPDPVTFSGHDDHSLYFSGARGEHLRLDILAEDVIRVQHLPDGRYRLGRSWVVTGAAGDTAREGRPRDDLTPFPLPFFDLTVDDNTLSLATGALQVKVRLPAFRLTWHDAAGQLFAADLPHHAYHYDAETGAVYHYLARQKGECCYGFGEKAGPLNKAGMRMRMANTDALAYNAQTSDPLYKHWPFYITLVPELNLAYGLLYDNLSDTVFDMGREINAVHGPYKYYQAAAGDLDYYLIFGPTIAAVVEKLTWLTGRPALLPRWSLGYLGSTMHYTEQPDAQAQLAQFVAQCERHDIPCDMFHLSSGYTADDAGRRCVFTWNHSRIPDPQAVADQFHDAGIHLAANVKPHLLACHPEFDRVNAAGGFVREASGSAPHTIFRWSGGIHESEPGAFVDFTSAAGFDWWQSQVRSSLLRCGIDAVWNDNNEFDSFDDAAQCAGFGDAVPLGMARPLQTLLMARASYEALLSERPGLRPYVLTRAGCPGVQRYAQTWTGDNTTSWHTLRYNIPMGLGSGLSGLPNTGHDVGGFAGGRPDPELFVRWVQNGIFHPRFTIHSMGSEGEASEPWMHPDALPHIRAALALRYRLIPYLYTLAFDAAQRGTPIIRPLVYHFQHDARCQDESFDFMLGPNLLVASVLEAGARARRVYLPSGAMWCDFYSGQWHSGGQDIEVAAPLEHIPLFVPAGGMIPTARPMRHVGQQPDDVRRVYVFPHPAAGTGELSLVEDDGVSLAYREGAYTRLRLAVEASATEIALRVDRLHRGFALPYSQLEFVLPAGEMRPLEVDSGREHKDVDGRRVVVVTL